ncbi:hypothetical protein [Shewanella algae]|uniref:hypothetical protein n=1 Tax=Shewanella algae TaxID=38313 RepID=UPI001AACFD1E|nr:hypothetical protein [Shewanella algae]MBO2600013.1 hypothetical protein [Shewanella algae]
MTKQNQHCQKWQPTQNQLNGKAGDISRARFRMWLETPLHEEIEAEAKRCGRSFTAQIQYLLKVALGHNDPQNRK